MRYQAALRPDMISKINSKALSNFITTPTLGFRPRPCTNRAFIRSLHHNHAHSLAIRGSHLAGPAVELFQSFALHLQFHLRILLEDLRVSLAKHLSHPLIGYASSTQSRGIRPAFLGRGKMLRPKLDTPQNTTIAALITLTVIHPYRVRLVELIGASLQTGTRASLDELKTALLRDRLDPELVILRVIVWHNAFARLPFPPDLFCGPYDTHFGVVRGEDGAFNAVTFRGGSS